MAELVLTVLQRVLAVLSPIQLQAAVMGGIAVSLWKHVRATQDVDLLVGVGPEDEAKLIALLESAGFRTKRQPPVLQLGPFRLLQLLIELPDSYIDIQVDLMLATSDYQHQALKRAVVATLPALQVDVPVLACEDLILHKLLAGRMLDRADVGALLRTNLSTLDIPYLVHWSGALGLEEDLKQICGEVLPNVPLDLGK